MEKMMVFQKTPKRQKIELSVDAKDWISELPESIKQRILFFLPPKDAARTTVLSKIWQQAWKSLRSIDFDFQNIHGSFFESQDSEPEDVKLEKFMNFVDKTLQILYEEMVIIQKFILPMSLTDAKHASCIDNWLELATRNYIKELELTIIGKKITDYTLSRRLFAVESLAILRLWGCKLVEPLFGENTKFICLQELSLLAVDLDGKMIQELVCHCPMLEALEISCCSRVDYLQLLNLPKLKKAEFDSCLPIKINEAPNLQILSCTGIVRSLLLDMSTSENVKKLKIGYVGISRHYLEELNSRFPLLETLEMQPSNLPEIKISHHRLEKFKLFVNGDTILHIDCKNLSSYAYLGSHIPSLSIKSSRLQKSQNLISIHYPLDASLFLKLRKYLGNFKQPVLSLRIDESPTITFTTEQLSEQSIPPRSNLNLLSLVKIRPSEDYRALIDGLLWSTHPESLSVSCVQPNRPFINYLHKNLLMVEEESQECCSDRQIKCWRHDLKGIKSRYFDGEKYVNYPHLKASYDSLQGSTAPKEIRFDLLWVIEIYE